MAAVFFFGVAKSSRRDVRQAGPSARAAPVAPGGPQMDANDGTSHPGRDVELRGTTADARRSTNCTDRSNSYDTFRVRGQLGPRCNAGLRKIACETVEGQFRVPYETSGMVLAKGLDTNGVDASPHGEWVAGRAWRIDMSSKKTTAIRSLALGLGVGAFALLQACAQNGDDVQTDMPDDALSTTACTRTGCSSSSGGTKPGDEKLGASAVYSKCEPIEVAKTYGDDKFYGNTRLVAIDKSGSVPCVHFEKGSPASCTFKPTSGAYIVSKSGNFARVGQAIGQDGSPGGDFIIASKVSDKGTVACVAPKGSDSAGVPAGVELASACVVETLNSPYNATGLKVVSYASLEVCTSSTPHPDGATLSSSTSTSTSKVYCYKGDGAGLNDINGTEKDALGVYYPGAERCHVIWSNGYEVPGSKRPSTKNYPAPGSVVITSPITWRPVTTVDVATP